MNLDEVDMLYTQLQVIDNRRDADEFRLTYWKKLLDAGGAEYFHIASAAIDHHRIARPGVFCEPGHICESYKVMVKRIMAGFREQPPEVDADDVTAYLAAIRQQRAEWLADPRSLDAALGMIAIEEEEKPDADGFIAAAITQGFDTIKKIGRI